MVNDAEEFNATLRGNETILIDFYEYCVIKKENQFQLGPYVRGTSNVSTSIKGFERKVSALY